ncbi:chromosome partitioning protein ParA [Deinococcus arenae]|uniref:Chromosome partitioning protein ParA n=1 Tax=Deinococcus arenae TaxID=1452751 RepID=A0A8H9GY08_9DEIO|nr:ParA family protein [Deinococcus arenae]AWT37484.1 chromosome partitioning protein ParA [Deinococcus actinosclerus]GGM55704.1 chromosome partitioning protein ParA [Deinococcus arenae]
MITATVFNHAGGAGKTSVTRDVGYEFARRGLRVLLIDLDPQANLTSWLGVRNISLEHTIFPVAVDGAALPSPIRVHGLDLIPSQVDLALAEAQMLGQPGAHLALKQALEPLQDQYDVVIVDSPPSIGQLAILGAGAADRLLVPIPTRAKGLDAMPGLQKATTLYRRLRRDLTVALYIPTLYDARRGHDREVLALLRENLSPICEPVPQREAVWLDSNSAGQPVGIYAPGSPVHRDVQRLAGDVARALGLEWDA